MDLPPPKKTILEILAFATAENLAGLIEEGKDPHCATAAFAWDIPLEDVTREHRSAAKHWNFGAIYGVTGEHLPRKLEKV